MTKFYFLLIVLIFASCGSSTNNINPSKYTKKCPKIYKNDFAAFTIEDYQILEVADAEILKQLKFFCVGGVSIGNLMFDDFGKWNTSYNLSTMERTLVWNNVDLMGDGSKYSVFTSGFDDQNGPMYISVMVLDEKNNDMLTPDSKIKERLISYFSEKIRNFDGSTAFLKELFMTFHPDTWKKYLKQNIEYRKSL